MVNNPYSNRRNYSGFKSRFKQHLKSQARTQVLNWEQYTWWLGCGLGSFLGGIVLAFLRAASTGASMSRAGIIYTGATVGVLQVVCIALAFVVWKWCLPRRTDIS